MGFRFPGIVLVHAKKNQVSSKSLDVPKGYLAIYVGETQKKRFVNPVSYLNQPSFQDLLSLAEDEFGYDLTIPCSEDTFLHLTALFGVQVEATIYVDKFDTNGRRSTWHFNRFLAHMKEVQLIGRPMNHPDGRGQQRQTACELRGNGQPSGHKLTDTNFQE